jgi:hypothetical protein
MRVLVFGVMLIVGGLCVSGLVLEQLGTTDQLVTEFMTRRGWEHANREPLQQAYCYGILQLYRTLPRSATHPEDTGGGWYAKIFLVGGVPVFAFDLSGYGLE